MTKFDAKFEVAKEQIALYSGLLSLQINGEQKQQQPDLIKIKNLKIEQTVVDNEWLVILPHNELLIKKALNFYSNIVAMEINN